MVIARTPAEDRDGAGAGGPASESRSLAAVSALLAERGIDRHAIFWDVGEGEEFPDDTESMSGNLIDAQGRIYFFWTDWDAARNGPKFGTWRQKEPEEHWLESAEYRAARAAVGLDPNRHGPEAGSMTKRAGREGSPRP